jgi:hypothetical protein
MKLQVELLRNENVCAASAEKLELRVACRLDRALSRLLPRGRAFRSVGGLGFRHSGGERRVLRLLPELRILLCQVFSPPRYKYWSPGDPERVDRAQKLEMFHSLEATTGSLIMPTSKRAP